MLCRNHVDVVERVRRCARCQVPYCPDCLVEIGGRPYCAGCKAEQLLDVRSGVDRTRVQLASRWNRFGATIVDGIIIAIPMYAVMGFIMIGPIMKGQQPPMWANFIGIPFSLLGLVYEGLMLQHKNGQTLGKMLLKVRVVRPDGSPITPGQAWGRTGIRSVLALTCLAIVDYIPAFFTDEKTTLHDMAAGTRVTAV